MEVINLIFTFIVYFFLESLIIQIVNIITEYKVTNKLCTAVLILINSAIIAVSISSVPLPQTLRTFIMFLVCFNRLILYILIFKKFNKNILYLFLVTLATNQIYSNITKQIFSKVNYVMVAYLLEALILAYIYLYIKKKHMEMALAQIISAIPRRIYILIMVMLMIASVFVMGTARERHELYIKYLMLPTMIGLIVTTIFIIQISISEVEKKASVEVLTRQIENQVAYYEKMNKMNEALRSFRHDFKNHIICIRSLLEADDVKKTLDYIDDIEEMSSSVKKQYNTGHIIIDALLNDKSENAKKWNIILNFQGYVPTNGISNADLCVIMANSIDNAIEACAKDKSNNEKVIDVESDFRQGYFFFKISNPIFEEVVFKDKNKLVTSKKDKNHHGIGVANIMRVVSKYNGNTEIRIEDQHFILDINLMLNISKQE